MRVLLPLGVIPLLPSLLRELQLQGTVVRSPFVRLHGESSRRGPGAVGGIAWIGAFPLRGKKPELQTV